MRRRSRVRWVVKWAGTVACGLVVVAWIASCFWWARFYYRGTTGTWHVDAEWGAVRIGAEPIGSSISFAIPTGLYLASHSLSEQWAKDNGVTISRYPADRDYYGFRLPAFTTRERPTPVPFWFSLTIPAWLPLLLFFVPTVYLFWRDRSPPPGRCTKCGYDLTGNVSGRCPECGAAVEAKTGAHS